MPKHGRRRPERTSLVEAAQSTAEGVNDSCREHCLAPLHAQRYRLRLLSPSGRSWGVLRVAQPRLVRGRAKREAVPEVDVVDMAEGLQRVALAPPAQLAFDGGFAVGCSGQPRDVIRFAEVDLPRSVSHVGHGRTSMIASATLNVVGTSGRVALTSPRLLRQRWLAAARTVQSYDLDVQRCLGGRQ